MIPKTKIMSHVNNVESSLYFIATTTALMIIFGFGLYKSITGEPVIALIDFSICLLLVLSFWLKSRDLFTEKIKLVLVIICSVFVLYLIYRKENISSLYWLYPIITGAFYLLRSRVALTINSVFLIASISIAYFNLSILQLANLFSSLLLVCVSGYIFSLRAEVYQKQLTRLADKDPLTKLKNRHSLEEELINEIALKKNNICSSSLLILDLDHFKRINDAYGHTIGDKTLVSFANMLKSTLRETDKVYRYGGEEFVIIATNTRIEKAGKLAEHLRQTTENTISAGNKPITVSIGVAEARKEDTYASWLQRADKALYEAKNSNRNNVFLAYSDSNYRNYNSITNKASNIQVYI